MRVVPQGAAVRVFYPGGDGAYDQSALFGADEFSEVSCVFGVGGVLGGVYLGGKAWGWGRKGCGCWTWKEEAFLKMVGVDIIIHSFIHSLYRVRTRAGCEYIRSTDVVSSGLLSNSPPALRGT